MAMVVQAYTLSGDLMSTTAGPSYIRAELCLASLKHSIFLTRPNKRPSQDHPLNMSVHRYPWDDSETSLLRQIRSELPDGKLSQISEAFTARNHQSRTKNAVKGKLRDLGLHERSTLPCFYVFPLLRSKRSKSRCDITAISKACLYFFVSTSRFPMLSRKGCANPSPVQMRSVPELRISIPLHPLIADARRHAAHVSRAGHFKDDSTTLRWPSTLGKADISEIRCADKDRVVLKNYLDYLARS